MPDPRRTVAFDDIGALRATYKIDNATIVYDKTKPGGSVSVGLAVVLSTDRTIALVADADPVEGKLLEVYADNMAAVQVAGYCEFPGGNAASLTIGQKFVGALGVAAAKGFIRVAAPAGGAYSQTQAADSLNGRGAIIDNDDTAKVIVRL